MQRAERRRRGSDRVARRGREDAQRRVIASLLLAALLELGAGSAGRSDQPPAIGPLRGPGGESLPARPSAPRARPPAPAVMSMGFEAALAEAEELNREGNELFGAKRYDEALAKYSGAAELVGVHAQRVKEAEAPWCKFLCNRAAAYLGAGYHGEAHKDCSVALSLDPQLDKALLRRALAGEALGKPREAMADALLLLGRIEYASPLHARALDVKRRCARLLEQERQVTESNSSEHLFTADQTLRLNFRTPPPGAVAVGDYFEVAVFVANEFGLFGTSEFGSHERPVELEATALAVHAALASRLRLQVRLTPQAQFPNPKPCTRNPQP
jgi:tetratricopeptide (TPR) repeat protein